MGQTVASGSGQGGGTAASGNHVVRHRSRLAASVSFGHVRPAHDQRFRRSRFLMPCARLLLAAVIFPVVCGVREPRNLLALCATCARSGASRRSPCWACF
ncbi:MAG: hypothetical protein ACLUYK_04075 [Eggerthella lenta]